jgi:beta-lactamase regulating signal transducer with metallopeptidase domain
MKTLLFNQWFTDREIKAICWTLIHSLWLGLVIAALAGIIIACTRRATPLLRYRLLCGLLVVFVCSVGYTLYYEAGITYTQQKAAGTATLVKDISPAQGVFNSNATYTFQTGLLNNAVGFITRASGWIFGIWLTCFIYKSLRLMSGVFYISRIRKHKTHQISDEWKDKVAAFSQSLGIRKKITLLQSELVKVPVTVGLFKPVILLPIGMIFQLTTGQVDTILLHELAHIYRRDYLVNILQSVVEAVFFFNPAVLWLSALIREEREACCDDMVLDNISHKGSYLEALLAFQDHKNIPAGLAMALSFRKNQLMDRLKRMVNQENKRLTMVEIMVLLLGMVFLSAFTFIPQVKSGVKNTVVQLKNVVSHTLPTTRAQQKYARVMPPAAIKSNAVVTTPADSETPDTDTDTTLRFTRIQFNHTNEDKANREMNVTDNKGNHYHIVIAANKLTTLAINDKPVDEAQLETYQWLIQQIDTALGGKLHKPHTAIAASNPRPEKHFNKKMQHDSAMAASLPVPKKRVKEPRNDTTLRYTESKPKKRGAQIDISRDRARVHAVIEELVREKVVPGIADVESFGLSDTELIVNGKKQPEALQKRLMESYGIKHSYGLFYGPNVTGKGVIMDKRDL